MRVLLRDLQPNEAYGVKFRLVGNGQQSDWSGITRFTTSTDQVAPANVTGLIVKSIGTAFEVTWDKVTTNTDGTELSDFKDYQVSITANGVTRLWNVTQERFDFPIEVNTNAFGDPQGLITVSVSARDNTLNIAEGGISVSAENAAPPTPTGFAAEPTVNGINFTWNKSDIEDLKYYQVYEGLANNSVTNLVYEGPANNFTWSSIDFETSHYFRLATVDVFNQETFSGVISGSPLSHDSTDKAPPANPTWPVSWFSSDTDLSNKYNATANVTLTWNANDETDLGSYIVRYKKDSDTVWYQARVNGTSLTPPAATVRLYGLAINTAYNFQVAAVDKAGNVSEFVSAPANGTTTVDNTSPPAPSAPIVTNYKGGILQVEWDGNDAAGAAMVPDAAHIQVHVSTATGFATSVNTLVSVFPASAGGNKTLLADLTYGTTYFIKLIAQDFADNNSVASAQASGIPQRLVDADIGDGAIKTHHMSADSIDGNVIMAQTLNASKIETGELAADVRIIAGPILGTHAEVTGTGFRVFAQDPTDNIPDEVIRMGTDTNDYFGITDSNGSLLASMDDTGGVNARTGNFREDIIVKGLPLFDLLARGAATDIVPGATNFFGFNGLAAIGAVSTEIGLIEVSVTVAADRAYMLMMGADYAAQTQTNTNGVEVVFRVRDGLDGIPTISSPVVMQRQTHAARNLNWPVNFNSTGVWHPVAGGEHRLLFTVSAVNGTAGIVEAGVSPHLALIDLGPRKPALAQVNRGGGSTTPPPRQFDTGEMAPAAWVSYRGNGTQRTDVAGPVQGWDPSGTNGDGKGYWSWNLPSITGTVNRVDLYLYSEHWYYNSGGTAIINAVPNNAGGPSFGKARADWHVAGFPKPGGKWVTLPSDWFPLFHNDGAYGHARVNSISVGPSGGTNLNYYGRFTGSAARLRIWYTQ